MLIALLIVAILIGAAGQFAEKRTACSSISH